MTVISGNAFGSATQRVTNTEPGSITGVGTDMYGRANLGLHRTVNLYN
jgi:hypothetical protein